MASLNLRTGLLGKRLATHLLRRTTFGYTQADIDLYAGLTADAAVDLLFNFPNQPSPPLDPVTGQTWVVTGRTAANSDDFRLYKYVTAWWMDEILHTTNILHKLMLFLHQNFTSDTTINSNNLFNQLQLFRHFAKGSYRALAGKICMDNGMLRYLDTRVSTKSNPNENFPREFFELFTIGKGPTIGPGNYTHYTETDIQEASRLFTGFRQDWSYQNLDPDTGIHRGTTLLSQHDITDKNFSAAFGNTTITGRNTDAGMLDEITDFVSMIFSQSATALNICRKFYRYFVHFNITPEVESDIIGPLANSMVANGFSIELTLKELLKSVHFYDEDDLSSNDELVGGVIKTPLDVYMGAIKYFKVQLPDPAVDLDLFYRLFYYYNFINFLCKDAGFDPFNPTNVAGYPAFYQEPSFDDLWINSSTLSFRYVFADMLLTGTRVIIGGALHIQLDVMAFVNDATNIPDFAGTDPIGVPGPHAGPRIASHLVQYLLDNLFPEAVNPARFSYFLDDLLLNNLTEINWMNEWDLYVSSNDDSNIRPQIEKLIRGILQAPEYQVV